MLLNTISHELMRLLPAFYSAFSDRVKLSQTAAQRPHRADNNFPVTKTPHTDGLFYYSHFVEQSSDAFSCGFCVCVCVGGCYVQTWCSSSGTIKTYSDCMHAVIRESKSEKLLSPPIE